MNAFTIYTSSIPSLSEQYQHPSSSFSSDSLSTHPNMRSTIALLLLSLLGAASSAPPAEVAEKAPGAELEKRTVGGVGLLLIALSFHSPRFGPNERVLTPSKQGLSMHRCRLHRYMRLQGPALEQMHRAHIPLVSIPQGRSVINN